MDFQTGPVVMGVLNVTPDSFSDGGEYESVGAAVERAARMVAEGARIIDIGGESTRPGSSPVPAEEQFARTVPVIREIRACHPGIAISIDTRLAEVARAALQAGADIVNDVSALQDDPALPDLIASEGVPIVLMHKRGVPADMQAGGGPQYDDVVAEVIEFLSKRLRFATTRGIDPDRVIIDPGIGFGKRVEHNVALMRHLDRFVQTGQPVLVGASRKSFIGATLGIDDPRERLAGSLACAVLATLAGVAVVRAHDVKATVDAVRMCAAIRSSP